MKYRIGRHGFFAAGGSAATAFAMSAMLALGACTTTSLDDVAPVSSAAATAPPSPTAPSDDPAITEQALARVEANAATGLEDGPRNTGEFPNLNVAPVAAAEQITPQEKAAMLGQLRAKQAAVAAAAAAARPADQVQNLKKIGATHADEALKKIEAAK